MRREGAAVIQGSGSVTVGSREGPPEVGVTNLKEQVSLGVFSSRHTQLPGAYSKRSVTRELKV